MFRALFHIHMAPALCVLLLSACGWSDSTREARAEESVGVTVHFTAGPSSLDALARGVVVAAVASDTAALRGFRLTEREHEARVWPEAPVSRQDGPEFPHALAWENIEMRNAAGLARLLSLLEGRPVEYRRAACGGPEERYDSYLVLTDCRVEIVGEQGEVEPLQIFRSVVLADGVYKLIRYEREHR